MRLWMVTWDLDFTQFLLEADTESEAIQKAIKVNKKLEHINEDWLPSCIDMGKTEEIMEDTNMYSIVSVDMALLAEIIYYRTDIWKVIDNVVCYWDSYQELRDMADYWECEE